MNWSPSALRTLEALAVFHFLADEHLAFLEIGKNPDSIRRGAITQLKQSGQCCVRDMKLTNDEFGNFRKRHYLHYLTPYGKLQAISEIGFPASEVWIPSGKNPLSAFKYPHRFHYITAHICLRKWIFQKGAEIVFFEHEYQGDKTNYGGAGKPRLMTRIDLGDQEFIVPDGIMGLRIEGKDYLFIIELHHLTETTAITEQLKKEVQNFPAILRKYETRYTDFKPAYDPYILSIHTRKRTLIGVQNAIRNNSSFSHALPGMRFVLLESFKQNETLDILQINPALRYYDQ